MGRPVLFGIFAALASGLAVGLWASVVAAPPEVTAGVASALGGVLGFTAFGATLATRLLRRYAAGGRRLLPA